MRSWCLSAEEFFETIIEHSISNKYGSQYGVIIRCWGKPINQNNLPPAPSRSALLIPQFFAETCPPAWHLEWPIRSLVNGEWDRRFTAE